MPIIEEVDGDTPVNGQPSQSSGNHSQTSSPSGGSGSSEGGSAISRIINHMSADKIEAVLWMSRLFTIISTINFFLPIFGFNPYSSYQKVLLSNAATSALRLHQRVPNFQFSREYLARLFFEDSAHYLFYSLIFVTGSPVSMALLPVFLYAVLHAQSYTKQLLNKVGPDSIQLLRRLMAKIEANQVSMLRFIACNEIFLMPSFIFLILTGQCSIIMPFLYYRFLSLRYSSRRNPYCRNLFSELRMATEMLCSKPQCPRFISNLSYKVIELISRMAPVVN